MGVSLPNPFATSQEVYKTGLKYRLYSTIRVKAYDNLWHTYHKKDPQVYKTAFLLHQWNHFLYKFFFTFPTELKGRLHTFYHRFVLLLKGFPQQGTQEKVQHVLSRITCLRVSLLRPVPASLVGGALPAFSVDSGALAKTPFSKEQFFTALSELLAGVEATPTFRSIHGGLMYQTFTDF
ncbi:uncharacterized protein G2W53_018682 [Senna tora]|uniref:Uncharacterized protein n=1 Tax=Senna tora TaxID=362788 RepID=A0A834TSD8_9FABA|nr:uncharacterized protein G2W53_018682 [Senna tora]